MTRNVALPGTAWRTAALLLEPDGVLVDTDVPDAAAWRWWARAVGEDPDELVARACGRPVRDVVVEVLLDAGGSKADADIEAGVHAVEERLGFLVRATVRRRGASGLLRSLPPRRGALVTSASAHRMTALLRRARLRPTEVVITAEDVPRGRPSPEAHLAAAAALGLDPAACTTVERYAVGVEAGRAAGMRVVSVVPSARSEAPAGSDMVIHDPAALQVTQETHHLVIRITREPKRYA